MANVPTFVVFLVVVLFVLLSAMMMLVVLIQRPQGGGLSEAFGSSSGSGNTAFGAKTGDALTTATILIFVLFIGTGIGLNYLVKPPVAPKGTTVSAPVGEGGGGGSSGSAVQIRTETGEAVGVKRVDPAGAGEPVGGGEKGSEQAEEPASGGGAGGAEGAGSGGSTGSPKNETTPKGGSTEKPTPPPQ